MTDLVIRKGHSLAIYVLGRDVETRRHDVEEC